MYFIIVHIIKLHSNKSNKPQPSWDIYETAAYDDTATLGAQQWKKYESSAKSWYFWFEEDNKMSYRYIFSIT